MQDLVDTKQKQSCPDKQYEDSNKPPRPKKGYIIETIDASGNVVMENGKLTTDAIDSHHITPGRALEQSGETPTVNAKLTNETITPSISTEKKVQQSSFGRSIRRSSNHSDFSCETSSGSKKRKYPNARLDNSISSLIVSSTQIESVQPTEDSSNAIELPSTSSEKIQEKKSDCNRSSYKSSSQMKRKADKYTKSDQQTEKISQNDSIQSDPLKLQNSESSKSDVAINGDDDLVEAYPPHGKYLNLS
jgi:hypothetical protein